MKLRLVAHVLGSALAVLAMPEVAADLPPTEISYKIEVRIDPATRGLAGRETIRWTNPTSEPVPSLRMHLYLNAFSHTRTTWLEEYDPDEDELDDLYRIDAEPWGFLEPSTIVEIGPAGRRDASWRAIQPDDGNTLDRSLIEVVLGEPVAPGGETRLEVEFEGRLPLPVARTGARDGFFFLAQWYPKVGMLEPAGVRGATVPRWAARQFHANSEFYAEFADYDVTIAVPEGWIVGATGRAVGTPVADGSGFVRHRYAQRAVHDFAAVAGRDLVDLRYRVEPDGGGPAVDVRHIVPAGTQHQIPRWHEALVGTMHELGRRIGPYPYDVLTVVTPPFAAVGVGGMEYPTLFTGILGDPLWDVLAELRLAETTVVHEFAHQYFQGLVATNEQEEAFLDEGLTEYWEVAISEKLFGAASSTGNLLGRPLSALEAYQFGIEKMSEPIREPIRRTPTELYAPHTWGAQVYSRTAMTLRTAERLFGQVALDHVFSEYVRRFAFGHPNLEDFLGVAREVGGDEMAAMLREGFEREAVPDYAVTQAKTERRDPPIGRVTTAEGVITTERDADDEDDELGLDTAAIEDQDGRLRIEITDPGWARGGRAEFGTVRQVIVEPEYSEGPPDDPSHRWYESVGRLSGPAWDHLPVDVELRFADGAIVRDRWDGRAAWREYRVVRHARLTDVRVDPELRIAVDVKPQNNARSVKPDERFVRAWSSWVSALGQWLAGSLATWY